MASKKNLIQRIEIAEKERRRALRKGNKNRWRALGKRIKALREALQSS